MADIDAVRMTCHPWLKPKVLDTCTETSPWIDFIFLAPVSGTSVIWLNLVSVSSGIRFLCRLEHYLSIPSQKLTYTWLKWWILRLLSTNNTIIVKTSAGSSILISAPSLGVYYCQQLTLSVCLSVCHTPSNCFFFCFSMESSHFWPSVLHVVLYKTLFFDFWFRPPNAQHLFPKIYTKSPKVGLYGR